MSDPPTRRRVPAPIKYIAESEDGWIDFKVPDVGWVGVLLADIEGQPEIVGLRLDTFGPNYAPDGLKSPAEHREVLGLALGARADAIITTARLRSLPLADLRAAAAEHLAGRDPYRMLRAVARQRGKALPNEHFQQVADVYRAAVDRRQAPLVAIQARWQVSRAGAAKYVARARELGYLGYPARPGIAGASAEQSPMKRKGKRRRG